MKKNKKLLMFLALNSVSASFAATGQLSAKSERIYNSIVKNIKSEKSNEKNYKLLEKILKDKNKELESLYLQNDYIVKPEYLEWQIFFSGFYNEKNKGGQPYNKPYRDNQKVKVIDLGVTIPIKGKNINVLDIDVNPSVFKPLIPQIENTAALNFLNIPLLDLQKISYQSPNVNIKSPSSIDIRTPSLNTYQNSAFLTLVGNENDLGPGTYILSTAPYNRNNAIVEYGRGPGGTTTSDVNSLMIVDVNNRRAVSIDSTGPRTFTNYGKIQLISTNTAGLEVQAQEGGTVTDVMNMINEGIIEGNNSLQAGMIFTPENVGTGPTTGRPNILNNNNLIELSGRYSTGMMINGWMPNFTWLIQAENNGAININGNNSYGMGLNINSDLLPNSFIKNNANGVVNIYGEESGGILIQSFLNESEINLGKINIYGDNSFGLYSSVSPSLKNSGEINLKNSTGSIGFRTEGGNLTNNAGGLIDISGGTENIAMYSISGGKNINNGTIKITDGTLNKGFFITGADSKGENNGQIEINADNSYGVVVTDKGSFIDNGLLSISGNDSYGIVSKGGTAGTGNSLSIDLTGENSIGIYAGDVTASSQVTLTGGSVSADNGGVNFGAGLNGTVSLNNVNFTVGNKSLGFFTQENGIINIQNSTGIIKGAAASSDRGTAFSLTGDGIGITEINSLADLNSLITASGLNLSNLTLNMESGSRLFLIQDASVKLSTINRIESNPALSGVIINGSDYKTMSLHSALLNIDEEMNLDNNNVEITNSSVINNSIIKGTNSSQQGIAQANTAGAAKSSLVLVNNGEINLSGQESVGIYADYGFINNNNIISTQGSGSFGIYGVNGTDIETAAGSIIKSGTNGAGIVSQSYILDPVTGLIIDNGYGDGTFKISHNGKIEMSGSNSFGIYADNNDTNILTDISARIINLNTGSLIDMSSTSTKGTALYANKATVNVYGNIKTGSEGIGIYADSSNITLNGGIIDISGDNATGIFLNGSSNMTLTHGVINIKGNNSTIFYINSSAILTGQDNVVINADPALKMVLANVKNNNFIYNRALSDVGQGSVLIAGENSIIGFETNAIIDSNSEDVTGLAANGGSAVNKGKLTFAGIDSMGIYTENADAVNMGELILGEKGTGIYNENGTVNNAGKIEIGEKGTGIYGSNSTSINNNSLIHSFGNSTVGIYENGDTAGSVIKNDMLGVINLDGSGTIGIYTSGNSAKNVTNAGEIKVGDSKDSNNPSIGIYNSALGTAIVNNGTLTSGESSLGIYDKGGNITENGILNVGKSGIGIYTDGGIANITQFSVITTNGNEAAAVQGKNNASVVNNSPNITLGSGDFGFILETGSNLTNLASVKLGDNNVFVYGDNAGIIKSADSIQITADGSNNIIFYTVNGGAIQNDSILKADIGIGNIGIFSDSGNIKNNGDILIGDSKIVYTAGVVDSNLSTYAVGIYGENSEIINYGDISLGAGAIGIYTKNNSVITQNYGNITGGTSSIPKTGVIGIIANNGKGIENFGNITLYGDGAIGIAGTNARNIINNGIIRVTGNNAMGIYAPSGTLVENNGTINILGTGSAGIVAPSGKIANNGTIYFSDGAAATKEPNEYPLPDLENMGLIIVNGHFSNEGMNISIKPDINTLRASTIAGIDFVLNSGTISANTMTITDTVNILPDFSQGTNANVYMLENIFITSTGQVVSPNGKLPVVSKSLTWEATPSINDSGNIDIYMSKLSYQDFASGFWYEGFGKILDEKYFNAAGRALSIFDKIDIIEDESEFRHIMSSLGGNIYANINQREETIKGIFDTSLNVLQNSENNTKENVKINVIAGKGEVTEDTDGITGYNYETAGILALREVERTYKHTFGYSLGYAHTGFEFKDGNESEEWVDTVQLGLHNKYKSNGWKVVNDLTGRASIHNIDRNIDWADSGRSEMNGNYQTYSVTSDNILGKEISLGKNTRITPYGGLEATYMTRPTFGEKGLESLNIEGNDAWSVKPKAGLELEGSMPLGDTGGWKLKGALDLRYEYELGDLNVRESAKLTAVENEYRQLAKPEDENGKFKTGVLAGVEIEDRYGIFLTGDYSISDSDQNEYKVGVAFKAVF